MPGGTDLPALVTRVQALLGASPRLLVGIVGPPGAGKSTVAERLVAHLPVPAVVVPFDGFHLAQQVLEQMGAAGRKGAYDTFDLGGYRSLLRRLRAADEPVVYAPAYFRAIEEAVAAAIAIPRAVRVVVTEGNYLLVPDAGLDGLLDETWYVEVDDATRLRRLIDRHVRFGKADADAVAWAHGSDETNADLVRRYRDRAQLVVRP